KVREHYQLALDAGLDVLVIQGTVVSAEHVSTVVEPLNLKEFIASLPVPVIVGGCASYQAALHLMRTGAAGVLVGVGPGAACTTRGVLGVGVPQATAIADAGAARTQHLLETGQYVNVIADGGMRTGGDISKAIACGADAARRPVLVVDFGAQYAQLIARRVRECRVYSEIVPHAMPAAALAARDPIGIILSGGPASIYEPGAPAVDPDLFELGVPVLG